MTTYFAYMSQKDRLQKKKLIKKRKLRQPVYTKHSCIQTAESCSLVLPFDFFFKATVHLQGQTTISNNKTTTIKWNPKGDKPQIVRQLFTSCPLFSFIFDQKKKRKKKRCYYWSEIQTALSVPWGTNADHLSLVSLFVSLTLSTLTKSLADRLREIIKVTVSRQLELSRNSFTVSVGQPCNGTPFPAAWSAAAAVRDPQNPSSGIVLRQTSTSPSDSVLSLIGIQHAARYSHWTKDTVQ